MALEKSVELATGVAVEYHKIGSISTYIPSQKHINFTVWMYLNKDARDNDKQAITQKQYQLDGESFDEFLSDEELKEEGINLLTQLYTHLKTLPEFEEAEDC